MKWVEERNKLKKNEGMVNQGDDPSASIAIQYDPMAVDESTLPRSYDWLDAGTTKIALKLLKDDATAIYFRGLVGLKDEEMKDMVDILSTKENNERLHCIALAFRNQNISKQSLKLFGEFLSTNRTLLCLQLKKNIRNHLDVDHSAGLEYVIDSLKKNWTLTDINLASNDLRVSGARKIARALEENRTLRGLNLYDNSLSLTGVISITTSLQVNRSLWLLNLGGNSVGDTGCRHLANALEVNDTLQVLSLKANSITSEGAQYLARSLQINKSLRRLSLQNNKITEVGGRAFIDVLILKNSLAMIEYANENNRTLRELYASRNTSADIQHVNKTLQILELRINMLKPQTLKEIETLVNKKFRCIFDFKRNEVLWSADSWLLAKTSSGRRVIETAIKLLDTTEIQRFRQTVKSTNKDTGQTMVEHLLRTSGESSENVTSVLDLLVKMGHFDMNQLETSGRSHSEAAEHHVNHNIRIWAKALNAFDGKYVLQEGAPAHRSATCDVYFATETFTNRNVALKILKEPKAYELELEIRKILGKGTPKYNQCILDYTYRSEKGSEFTYLEFERADRSLFDVINNERLAGIDLRKVREVATQAAVALEFMHSKDLIHGDFKPRNFLRVDYDENVWKLIDFDAAVGFGDEVIGEKHSSAYAPPEMARYLYKGTRKVTPPKAHGSFDVWSFGVVLYELLSGTPLFLSSKTDDHLFSNGVKAEVINWLEIDDERLDRILANINIESKYIDAIVINSGKDLVKMCLKGDKTKRPSFKQILNHPFFNEIGSIGSTRLLQEMFESKQTHFFLSYMQRQAAGTVKDIYNITRAIGATSWLDMEVNDLTLAGMRKGVKNARAFILVLNRDTLFSPYVLLELMWAVDMKKKCIFCVELDNREGLYPFNLNAFWETWKNMAKLKEIASGIRAIADLKAFKFTGTFLNPISKYSIETRDDVDIIQQLLDADLRNAISTCIKSENLIPYRRRKYETAAMVDHLMETIGFVPPSTLVDKKIMEAHWYLNLLSLTRIVVLVPPPDPTKSTEVSKAILGGITEYLHLQDYESQWIEIGSEELLPDNDALLDGPIVVLGVISPNIFEGMHRENLRKLKTHSRVFIHDNIFTASKVDQDNIMKGEFADMFSQTEIIPYRPPEPRAYEHKAMLCEIARRITRFGLSQEQDE